MGPLVKIFLVNALIMTSLFYAETQGALSLIIHNDASYLSILIMTLYVCMSIFLGIIAYHGDAASRDQRDKLLKKTRVGYFVADHLFTLGLLGTIIGLCVATSSSLVEDIPVNDFQTFGIMRTGLNRRGIF